MTSPTASFGYSARAWITIASRIASGRAVVVGPGWPPGPSGIDVADRSACHDPEEQGGVPVLGLLLDHGFLELEPRLSNERAIPLRTVVAEEHRGTEPVVLHLIGRILGAHRGDQDAAGSEPSMDRDEQRREIGARDVR